MCDLRDKELCNKNNTTFMYAEITHNLKHSDISNLSCFSEIYTSHSHLIENNRAHKKVVITCFMLFQLILPHRLCVICSLYVHCAHLITHACCFASSFGYMLTELHQSFVWNSGSCTVAPVYSQQNSQDSASVLLTYPAYFESDNKSSRRDRRRSKLFFESSLLKIGRSLTTRRSTVP